MKTNIRGMQMLTEAGASALVTAGIELAAGCGHSMAVAVVDAGGHLIAFRRMDGAPFVCVDVAIGKARTAAAIGAPSAAFEDMINGGAVAMLSAPGLVPLQGGVPVLQDGKVVGAVGVSGGSGEEDAAVATATAIALDGTEDQA